MLRISSAVVSPLLLLVSLLPAAATAAGEEPAVRSPVVTTVAATRPETTGRIRIAQTSGSPFTMTPAGNAPASEGNSGSSPAFQLPAGAPDALARPTPPVGAPNELPNQAPPADAPFHMPGAPALPAPQQQAATPQAPKGPDRFIIPFDRLSLQGEYDSRSWTVYLTEDEVAKQATLMLAYVNAVLVMPEVSRLKVSINGQPVIETPIASSTGPSRLSMAVRKGILRAGANLVRFEVLQRHRTDCGVQATYELWTEIDNAGTGLTFSGGRVPLVGGLENLPAVGVNVDGTTAVRVITTNPSDPTTLSRVMRAVQGLALRGHFATPTVSVLASASGPATPGVITMVMAPAPELAKLMGAPPTEAQQRAVAGLVRDNRIDGPVLVVSGPNAQSMDAAIERLNAVTPPSPTSLSTATFTAPDAPLFVGARSVRLADLGVPTQEFSGRRLRVRFNIGLPDDFYASVYGQAIFLLDAAFTASVQPGSHVDLYVNGQIASNLPITSRGGGLFQRQPIKIPLHNFRPGLNRLWLEVVLDTEADDRCLPGATLPGDDRFVLFDSSEFTMPDFARIGRVPDLAAFAAAAFPYNRETDPLALVLARPDLPTASAAATLMARLALNNRMPVPVEALAATTSVADRSAIFVGGVGQLASGILGQVGIAETSRVSWLAGPAEGGARASGTSAQYDDVLQRFRNRQRASEQVGNANQNPGGQSPSAPTSPSDNDTYERWRDNISGISLRSILNGFENWMQKTFDISYASLRIGRQEQAMFEPPSRTTVLLAQGSSPSGNRTWTLVTGRTSDSLATGLAELVVPELWDRVAGRASVYQSTAGTIENQNIVTFRFMITEPLGLANFRMVAANWLSVNIVTYALILVLCGSVLGVSTAFLLRRLGRN
ncbi:cellulose biosynthesis cyclic di-GMP-binding regulatory protein BcsB [Ancylobacter sp. 6x-1]|uniref:Cyclic di-GMP-binding protein n=1 Tax=Ancylobacter crimeensis TaxID=2579147 RepID=A0ABT0DB71_9HYPH|nr:cellulose biosynthesis cyclic di-GMP-binding regulatory protein BcsB [Ancylobacter crimeensis]MCK0197197.1 cellulose biosynthesis cyclic di-GMP-binding regulatory protein BcsB [Ancylobacter crimeensis]